MDNVVHEDNRKNSLDCKDNAKETRIPGSRPHDSGSWENLPRSTYPGQMTASPSQGIGWAIKQMDHGLKVRRRGWNGRGMWLALQVPDLQSKMTHPYVYMSTADGYYVPWLCSQTDLLAIDWEIATI